MSKNYLYELKQVEEIVDECDGESDSILCQNCPCTDYGIDKNYSSHPDWGMVFCEGSHCDEAKENVREDLVSEYGYKKGELNMKEAKMNVEIDLSILEQNLVKMATDKLEEEVMDRLVDKFSRQIEKRITDKLDKMVEERVTSVTEGDIYNIQIEIDNEKISLFDLMVKQIIQKAQDKSIEFSNEIDRLSNNIQYKPVDEDSKFTDDEFKVLASYSNNEYGEVNNISVQINGKQVFDMGEGEPEDMTMNRNLCDAMSVPEIIKKAYLAGKSGKIMYEASETVE